MVGQRERDRVDIAQIKSSVGGGLGLTSALRQPSSALRQPSYAAQVGGAKVL